MGYGMGGEMPGIEIATACGGTGGCPRVSMSEDGHTLFIRGAAQLSGGGFGEAEGVVAVPTALVREAVEAVSRPAGD